MSSQEIYVSTDVEADGPIPGPNSMLSFASAAYTGGKELIGTFSANLEPLPGATADPKTAEWWARQPEAWAACRQELEMPETAVRRYVLWLKALPGKPVFVGYPAGFDFLFVYWYLIRFAGESPFGFSALDIKTYAMAVLKKDYRKSTKSGMPKQWFDSHAHTHVALDDALEQGALFCNMLVENLGKSQHRIESRQDSAPACYVAQLDTSATASPNLSDGRNRGPVSHSQPQVTDGSSNAIPESAGVLKTHRPRRARKKRVGAGGGENPPPAPKDLDES